ncbi:MAG: transcriptional regulator [Candidatus Bathyarchaeales archaeon]
MSLPCEIAVKCLLPPVRALLAKELTAKYNLKQSEAAKLLGVSQPAVSLYQKKIRGKAINLEKDREIMDQVENLANALSEGNLAYKDFIQMFCEICRKIRAKGLLCQMHKAIDPSVDTEKCGLCLATSSIKCV